MKDSTMERIQRAIHPDPDRDLWEDDEARAIDSAIWMITSPKNCLIFFAVWIGLMMFDVPMPVAGILAFGVWILRVWAAYRSKNGSWD